MAEWLVALTDRAGQTRAFVDARALTVTRRLGNLGPSELSFAFDLDDPAAADALPGARLVRAYRDRVLRFHGVVWSAAQTAADNGASVSVVAYDPSRILERRYLRSVNQREFTQVDAGEIARTLVDDQPAAGGARWYTHLEAPAGNVAPSVRRDRVYDLGKQVLEAIVQLGEVDDGFYFRVDPVAYTSAWQLGSTGLMQVAAGELHVLWPDSGIDREELRFEHGDGTLDTASGVERTLALPTNHVLALGESGTISAVEVDDTPSQETFGVLMEAPSFPDVSTEATLREHALAHLRPTLRDAETVTFTPSVTSPMLWDDFDVGDIGRLYARRGALELADRVRVLEAQVAVSDDGAETLSSLTVERA